MYARIIFAVLMVSLIGCTELKERFGTGEETPELKAAREACSSLAESKAKDEKLNEIQQKEQYRVTYNKCMEDKGYNDYGRKITEEKK
jgi:hypothetical protein